VYDSEVASENFSPLEELKYLDRRVDSTTSLDQLHPVFERVEEIARKYSGDFEVQLAAHEVKQRVLAHGSKLRQMRPEPIAAPPPAPLPISQPISQPPPVETVPHTPVVTREEPQEKRRGMAFLWIAVGLVLLLGAWFGIKTMAERNAKVAQETPVEARITTVPPGASIQINGQQTCLSDCISKLAPGTYQVTALLDGYTAASGEIKVEPQKGGALTLTLAPQPVNVRVVADLKQGQVFLDDQPAAELQEGQWSRTGIDPGTHTLRIVSGTMEASFTFEIAGANMPAVQGPVTAKNLIAAIMTTVSMRGRLVTSAGPLKLSLNGMPQADATVEGIDLTGYSTGSNELSLGEGTSLKIMSETFDAAPGLTAFLKTDQNLGTLLISTGQDDVRVFINDKEQKRRTQKGDLRVQTIGKVMVRVEKPGFEPVPAQTFTVEKNATVKAAFAMKELPKVATLAITGGLTGTQVVLDQRVIGAVGNDGAYRNASIAPGDHTIELRRDQYEPKRFVRSFRAGQTVTIAGGDASLVAIRVAPPPPPPEPVKPKPEPPPVKVAPKKVVGDISNFDRPGDWREQEGIWRHRGEANLTYGLQPNGIFTFSIYLMRGGNLFRGGRVRWFLNYTDAKNYILFELDEENLTSKVVQNGKTLERKKAPHKQPKDMRVWNIQIDSSADRLIHKIQGDDAWITLDTWSEPGRDFTQGKFGIQVTGNDEVGLSNFQFTGR
jgi:hypothetical protein